MPILSQVFKDKRILGLSFGSKLGGVVRHCYPLNDNPRNPYCKGVEGLLDGYKATLNNGNIIWSLGWIINTSFQFLLVSPPAIEKF